MTYNQLNDFIMCNNSFFTHKNLQAIAKMLCVRSNKSERMSVYAEMLSKGPTRDMFKHEKDF